MGENILSNLSSFNDRVFIPNKKTKEFLQNSEGNLLSILNNTVIESKNLLIKENQNDIKGLYNYLLSMAKDSFEKEKQLYKKIEKDNSNFSDAIEAAFNTGKYTYLKTPYNNGNLGQTLTNLFYGGNTDKIDEGLTQFIIEMGHLDTHKFIEDMEISSVNIATNMIYNKIDNFFQEAKYQKNLAYETNNAEVVEVFDNTFNERTVFDYLQGKKDKLTEADAKKAFPKEMKTIIEKAQKTNSGPEVRKAVQQGNIDLAISYNEVIKKVANSLIESLANELTNIELKDTDIYNFIKEILMDKEIVKVSKKGYVKEGGFVMASYTINMPKLREKVAKYVVEKNEEKSNQNGILKKIEEADIRKIMNDGVKATIVQYNQGLYKYIVGIRADQLAWEYYENNLLQTVTQMVLRDWEESLKPESVSQIYQELEKANFASIKAAEWNKSVKQIEYIEEKFKQTSSLSSEERKQISDIVNKFDKTDKDDADMINEIEKAFINNNYQEGIKILRKRLKAKRAGYIANFNGSIGEIFISAILQNIAPQGFDVYQKGSSKNLKGQSAHADITYGDIGIQSKVYENNNLELYKDTKVTFKTEDALRYLNTSNNTKDKPIDESELQAFRFFLLNNTILNELGIIKWTDNDFITALNLRLANFIRYSDGLTSLANIKNNFFIINFNIVPASVIFLKMADLFKERDIYDDLMISFTNDTDYNGLANYSSKTSDDSQYLIKNLLKYLGNSKAIFKSFELNLEDIGANIF